jgi:hypothetical protein
MARALQLAGSAIGVGLVGATLLGGSLPVRGQESAIDFYINEARRQAPQRQQPREAPFLFGIFGPSIRITRPPEDEAPRERGSYGGSARSREFVRLVCVRACDNARLPLTIQSTYENRTKQEEMCQAAGRGAQTRLVAEPLATNDSEPMLASAKELVDGRAHASPVNASPGLCPAEIAEGGFNVPLQNDLTLRRGDIVATADGFRMFVGRGLPPFVDSDFVATRAVDGKRVADLGEPDPEPRRGRR